MVEEKPIPEFLQWLPGAMLHWLIVVMVLALIGLVLWLVLSIARIGPDRAAERLGRVLASAIPDVGLMSLRRVLLALSGLAVKESIRRWILVVVVVFLVVLLFAGWFLDPASSNPVRLYIGFVLTTTTWLVLILALFLSALSLPTDIKNRTIYTVVTKPVRPSEIVLGRILGFGIVGTLILAFMGLISYAFILRGLSHTHEVVLADLKADQATAAGKTAGGSSGKTSVVQGHQHDVHVDAAGNARLEMGRGHWHTLSLPQGFASAGGGGPTKVETDGPEGLWQARVPIKGKLHFLDRRGNFSEQGVCNGDEWSYRSYVEGGSLAAAIWTFEGITEERFPKGLPVELTISVFRTYKDDIEKGIPGSLTLRNPANGFKVQARIFTAKKIDLDTQFIPRTLQSADGKPIDLFKDLVSDGRVEIWLRCLRPMQYFGVARNDLYLRASNVPFLWNFCKGYLGIWLQMMLVIIFGVLFSTFLGGPIAVLATVGILIGGMSFDFVSQLGSGKMLGGGPIEAAIRLGTQQNLTSDMEAGVRTAVARGLDNYVMGGVLWCFANVLPDFGGLSYADYVADGFNVPTNLYLVHSVTLVGFLLPVFVAAFFFLKTRELAQL